MLAYKMKPILQHIPEERKIEFFVTKHFADYRFNGNVRVKLGNDEKGVPDSFIYKENELIACIELSGYIFNEIEDIRSHKLINGIFHIDIEKSTQVHIKQPPPFTLIKKKIEGKRRYERYDADLLILLIYSDVRIRNDELIFAMVGPMQISPSCNNFTHHRTEIIEGLRQVISSTESLQWDEIWLIDYTEFLPPIENKPQRLDTK